jgi:integral membrane sensor domain MASE1
MMAMAPDMSRRLPLFALVCFSGACFGGAELARLASHDVGGVIVPGLWLPAGLFAAALLRSRRQDWMLWLLAGSAGTLVSTFIHGEPLLTGGGFALVTVLEAAAAAVALARIVDAPFTTFRLSHLLRMMLVAAAAPTVTALITAAAVQQATGSGFFEAWRARWLADVLGLLLGLPMMLAAIDALDTRDWTPGKRTLEATAAIAAAVVLAELVFGDRLPPPLRVPALVLPVFMWGAFRLDAGGAAATLFASTVIGLWHTTSGEGPLTLIDSAPDAWTLRAQGTSIVASMTILLFASIVSERKQIALERGTLLAELQQALAEIRTLRGMIPICAWCHKVRDDAGFWQQIDTYIHEHTHATFSHSICPDCTTQMDGEMAVLRDELSP